MTEHFDQRAIRRAAFILRIADHYSHDELDAALAAAPTGNPTQGRGGVAAVSRITGLARSTIGRGLNELRAGEARDADRVRRPGGGRKPLPHTGSEFGPFRRTLRNTSSPHSRRRGSMPGGGCRKAKVVRDDLLLRQTEVVENFN